MQWQIQRCGTCMYIHVHVHVPAVTSSITYCVYIQYVKSGEINPHVKEAWKVTKSGVKGDDHITTLCLYCVSHTMYMYTV